MNLLTKFSLIFTAVFTLCLIGVGLYSRHLLEANARDQVHEQAKIMMETAMSVRTYTSEHIKPLLNDPERPQDKFHRESVPAWSATEIFLKFRKRNPEYADYSYKEATSNPTNPRDQARGWEEDIVNDFRLHKDRKELRGERESETGDSLYLAKPLVVGSASCLDCHGKRSEAPPEMINEYNLEGTVNGFGWEVGEVIGAQIVSVPVSKAMAIADSYFNRLMFWLIVMGLVTLLILNLVLYYVVIKPIKQFASNADSISKGQMDVEELVVKGRDEISVLASAFNRMHRSLAKAMKFLDKE